MIRILIVEDRKDQCKRMTQILQKAFPNHEIFGVGSVNEAKNKIKELRSITLAIVDYELNDGNGYELLEYFKENLSNVPVIIVTAYGKDENKEVRAGLSLIKGAADFMHKPIEDVDELIQRVKHCIEIAELSV